MKSHNEYRLDSNPDEQVFNNNFQKMFERHNLDTLSAIVFGWNDDRQKYPKDILSEREEDICISLIQWLGSPVGKGFLDKCGFTPKKDI
jgi:hypothetical protein